VMDKDTHEELANELKGLYEDVRKRQANLQRLVQTWFSNAIFGNGRFHGDLHGGNIMVDENGEVTVIDFGNAPVFAQSDRKNVVKLLVAAMRGDADAVLKATYALVSDDSKAVLTNTNKRTALKNKLLEMFKLGGIWNAAERIKAVFGELSRAGIEIPAALYNFTEALGRVQQLSDSMAATLERISGALPYLREHRFEDVSEADQKILTLGENKNSLKSIDKFIDETLAYHIRRMHRDEPNLSDAEIIRRLKKSIEKGELNEVFDAFGTSSNPVTAGPLHDLVNAIAAGNVSGILRGGHELAAESLLFDSEEDPKKKTVAELFQTKSKVLVEKILDPYISLNPALGPLKDELNGLLGTIYSGDSTAPSNIFITFRINLNGGNILDANASEFDENAQLNSDEFVSCPYEEVRQRLAHCKVQMAVLIRDRILPEIAKAFKTRLRQIAKDFDVSGLKPPVKMLDSMASSVKWHVLPTIKLGGTNAIGLGASLLWKLVKEKTFDKPIEIRANFGMEIADFRSFACEGRGRIRATKDKQLEFTSSLNTLSVHNAEAWRALVESLRTDLHKDEKTFWESLAGQKIAAILGLRGGATLNDVEKASPLTSEFLQVVLAAHDMYKLDHTAPSIRAIKSHLAPAANMSFADVTYDTFKGKLEAAFTAVCGRSVAGAFGIDNADSAQALETLMKSLYGKVIVRMSEIGAADPYYAVTGKVPGDTDVQRWMVAASRDVLAAEKVLKVDQLSKLEDILVGKLDRQYVDALAALGLPSTSLVRTAMLLRGLGDKATSDELVAFLRGQIGDKGATFRLPPDQSAIGREDFNRLQAGARFLDGLKEAAKVPDAARDEVMKSVRSIGYGLLPIATDDGLYKRYKQGEALDDALQNDLMVRIRQANYVNNPKPPPDDEEELGHVLAFWNAKKNCERQLEPEQELDPQEEELPSEEKYRGFFGILRGISEMIGD